jgi:hypothetical protein
MWSSPARRLGDRRRGAAAELAEDAFEQRYRGPRRRRVGREIVGRHADAVFVAIFVGLVNHAGTFRSDRRPQQRTPQARD